MKKDSKPARKKAETVIPLEDLAPRQDPKGGKAVTGKTVFGEGLLVPGPGGVSREANKERRENPQRAEGEKTPLKVMEKRRGK